MKKLLLKVCIINIILIVFAGSVYAAKPFLTYSTSTFTVGIPVNLTPGNTGGAPISCTATPTLPMGLSISATGVISGTPIAVSSTTTYTITATNANGTQNPPPTIIITVIANPKPVISYTSPDIFTVNTAITSLSPTNIGSAATSYSASSLPTGLSIDPVTGIISGTPTTISAATVYTVTATNASGSGTFNLTITISIIAPPVISYNPSTYTFGLGSFSSTSTPTNTGGAVTDPIAGWTSSPALPAGLSFSVDTSGTITGTPTALSVSPITYTITATNAGGSSSFQITISVISNYFDWTGAVNSDWATPGNWNFGSTVQTVNYPGKTATTDIVHIGVVTFSNTNSPTVFAILPNPVASITFGNARANINLLIASGATLAVSGNVTLNATNEKVNLSGGGTFSIGGDYLAGKSSTLNNSGCPIIMSGNFTNYGTNNFGTALLTFSGSSSTSLRSTGIQLFTNVLFSGSRVTLIQKLSGGKFALASNGILTMSGSAHVNIASGNLTLNSDATGSATIAAIPSTCILNGNITVQRFLQGSTDFSKRGYRLLSSPIYTGNDGTSNVFDFQYLLNSIYVSGSGGATNGFNVNTTQNPSIYLFREDVTPPADNGVIFTTAYNWKGIAKINNSPAYLIGTQAKNTTTNILDATVTIPVGNGFLVLFRGDKTASLVAPLTPPKDVTLSQTGTLNIGTINVRLWFAGDANLGNNLSYTLATTAAVSGSTASLTGGYTLVGNPYASTINWEKFNRNGTNSSLYGGSQIDNVIYMFNVYNKQYEPYQQNLAAISSVADTTTAINPGTAINQASNMIASGQGFFIITRATGQTFSFRETAKTNTLPVAASLNKLMGKPKDVVAAPQPLLRLKLSKDSINTDEIVIRLNNQASAKFIHGEDAFDLGGGSGALVSLSSISSDSVNLAINFMPFPGLQQQPTRLFVDAAASGLYTLARTQLDNLPALYDVWLKDAFTNDSLDMKANSLYQFTIDRTNPPTFGSNRFTLVIRQNPALAYHLLDFNAARVGNSSHVEVVWHTENEQNYTNFTVERSNDGGTTFDVVGGLQGTGAGNYSLVDKNAFNGQNLYRLKQEDLNNTITYSKVVAVLIDGKNNSNADQIHVYPNPAINVINMDITAKTQGNTSYDIIVTNSSGFTIKQATSSQASWQSGVSDLLPGTYLIKVVNTKDKSLVGQSKFVKL
jgi:hypothetical protein